MLWVVGRIIKYLIIISVLLGLIGVALVLFFNPNNFKQSITKQLQSYTGLPLEINGDVKWVFHPKAGLFLTDVTLPNPDDNNNPSVAKAVNIYVDPYSLLKDNLVITSLQIEDANFIWSKTSTDAQNPAVADLSAPAAKGPIFIVQELLIKNTGLKIRNDAINLNLEIKNANINANNLIFNSGADLPLINLTGTLVDLNRNLSTNISTGIKTKANTQELALDPLTITWNEIPLTGKAQVTNILSTPVIAGDLALDAADFNELLKKISPYLANTSMATNHSLQVKASYDYSAENQILDLSNFALKLDEGSMNGTCRISFQTPYRAEFAVTAENLDFAPLKVLFDALFPGMPSDTLVSVDLVKNLSVAGKFTGSKLQIAGMQIDQTTLEVIGENGLIQVSPFTLSAYGGMHNLSIELDVTSKETPFFKINEQANKVDMEPWLKLIDYTNVISGEATIKASLEALGNNLSELKQSLTGTINLYLQNGVLSDIDMTKLMNFTAKTVNDVFDQLAAQAGSDVYSLLRNKASGWIDTQKENPQTPFDSFELKADIKLGISNSASLSLNNSAYEMKATGGFNLIENNINFDALISYKTAVTSDVPTLALFMQQAPLPLTIGGTIQKPTFGPNIQNYAASVINLAQTDIMNKALTLMLASTPTTGSTSKTASELFIESLQGLNK